MGLVIAGNTNPKVSYGNGDGRLVSQQLYFDATSVGRKFNGIGEKIVDSQSQHALIAPKPIGFAAVADLGDESIYQN